MNRIVICDTYNNAVATPGWTVFAATKEHGVNQWHNVLAKILPHWKALGVTQTVMLSSSAKYRITGINNKMLDY